MIYIQKIIKKQSSVPPDRCEANYSLHFQVYLRTTAKGLLS